MQPFSKTVCRLTWMVLVLSWWDGVFGQGPAPAPKLPVPSAAELARAEKLIDRLFQEDLVKAKKDPALACKLAATFVKEASQIREDPSLRYATLRQAVDLAGRGGDLPLAFQAIASLAEYAIEPLELKMEVLQHAEPLLTSLEMRKKLLDATLDLVQEAAAVGQLPLAEKLLTAADKLAEKLSDKDQVRLVEERKETLKSMIKARAQLQTFEEMLKKDPKDPKANLGVGQHWAFLKGQWARGLPYLALGNDQTLQILAKVELSLPKQPKDWVYLGDGWWQAGENAPGLAKKNLLLHSLFWYEQALPHVDVTTRLRLEKRLDQLAKEYPDLVVKVAVGEIRRFEGHTQTVTSVEASPDGRYLLTASFDKTARLYDIATGKEMRRFLGHTSSVQGATFSPDGKKILTFGTDPSLRLWDTETAKLLQTFQGTNGSTYTAAFSPDGKRFVTGGFDKTLRLWDVERGNPILLMKGHTLTIMKACFTPDGKRILSASSDKSMRLWDAMTGQEVRNFLGHTSTVMRLAISRDGKQAASGSSDGTVRLWDLDTGREIRRLTGHVGSVMGLAFSPKGNQILTGTSDQTVRLWDTATGKELHRIQVPGNGIRSLTYLSDGRRAVFGSADGSIRLWGLPR